MSNGRVRRDWRAVLRARSLPPGASGRPRWGLEPRADAGGEGRVRRDPFAERRRQTVSTSPCLRLDRGGPACGTAVGTAGPVQSAGPRPVSVDAPACLVMVVPDAEGGRLSNHDRQLLGAARKLADAASGAVLLLAEPRQEIVAQAPAAGVDRFAPMPPCVHADQRAAVVAGVTATLKPRHVLFPESLDGGDLARRVAALTGEPLLSDLEFLSPAAAIRPARALQVERIQPPSLLLALQAGRAPPYAGLPHEVRPVEIGSAARTPTLADNRVGAPYVVAGDPETLPLAEAPFVVAAGNGVTDFERFRLLVARLRATPGASRVVCDAGLMPRACQVGASGTVLDAGCYMAIGISGAPQHLQGVGKAARVIAVNTDLHAAMVERAELAIIADAQQVMAALVEELERRAALPQAAE